MRRPPPEDCTWSSMAVEDPHNLGRNHSPPLMRAGAAAVCDPGAPCRGGSRKTVGRAAAGALAYMPVVRVVNINRTLDELKERGYWIYGLDERGKVAYDQVEFTRSIRDRAGRRRQRSARTCGQALRFSGGAIPMAGTSGVAERQRCSRRDAVRVESGAPIKTTAP